MKNDVPDLWRQRVKAGLCPVCGKTQQEFEKRMRVYCSPACRDEYASKYTYLSVERDKFLKEHGEKCDNCGITKDDIRELRTNGLLKLRKEWCSKPEIKKAFKQYKEIINDTIKKYKIEKSYESDRIICYTLIFNDDNETEIIIIYNKKTKNYRYLGDDKTVGIDDENDFCDYDNLLDISVSIILRKINSDFSQSKCDKNGKCKM